jgi:hypothetical protein
VSKNFQEEIPLKMKSLLVITLFAVCCSFASAQLVSPTTYDRTFYGYCNGEHMVLQKLSGTPGPGDTKVFVAGYEDLVDACGFPYNAPTVGQKHGISAKVYPRVYTGVNGTYLDIASAAEDAINDDFSGYQEEWIMDVKNNIASGYFSELGFNGDYLFTSVYLTNGLPAKTGNSVGKPVVSASHSKNAKTPIKKTN